MLECCIYFETETSMNSHTIKLTSWALSHCFSISLKVSYESSHQWNSEHEDQVFVRRYNTIQFISNSLLKCFSVLIYNVCYHRKLLPVVATDGKHGNGLKLEKYSPFLQKSPKIDYGLLSPKTFISYLPVVFAEEFCT